MDKCPACNEYIDYCQGHGEIGDPYGFEILVESGYFDNSY